jgi:hypothetical protein
MVEQQAAHERVRVGLEAQLILGDAWPSWTRQCLEARNPASPRPKRRDAPAPPASAPAVTTVQLKIAATVSKLKDRGAVRLIGNKFVRRPWIGRI